MFRCCDLIVGEHQCGEARFPSFEPLVTFTSIVIHNIYLKYNLSLNAAPQEQRFGHDHLDLGEFDLIVNIHCA